METRRLTSPEDLARYASWLREHPNRSLWQSPEWKGFQEALGREVRLYAREEHGTITASALVVIDRTIFGLSTWDIARGPLLKTAVKESRPAFMEKIIADAKADGCLTLYFSPSESLLDPPLPLRASPSRRCEQLEATIMIDLTQTEEQILAQMHQKARYNIKVAQKHGVEVTQSDDSDAFHSLLKETGSRDQFTILPKSHYEIFLQHVPGSFLLLAYPPLSSAEGRGSGGGVKKEPLAGLLGVIWDTIGIYYYGASSYQHRALMAPYLLQWEAMTHCKAQGCHAYDLLGISSSVQKNDKADDPWAGITEFKRKFGGKVVTYPQEQMITLKPLSSRMLQLKRKIIG